MLKMLLLFSLLLWFGGCEEKAKPVIKKSQTLTTPIDCMALNTIGLEKDFVATLKGQYPFDESCSLKLNLSYKKDIVCNSSYNAMSKNMGRFPKSFVKLELRKGLGVVYSYYVDLYSNVDEDDLIEGVEQLKKDLLSK